MIYDFKASGTMLTNDSVFNKIDQITTNNIVAAI
jgi:hypothetical protein